MHAGICPALDPVFGNVFGAHTIHQQIHLYAPLCRALQRSCNKVAAGIKMEDIGLQPDFRLALANSLNDRRKKLLPT